MIKIKKLSQEDQQCVIQMNEALYLHGSCYVYAMALNIGLGWPIIGLMNGDEIHHTGVRSPDGRFFDARGFVEENEITKPFSTVKIDCLKEVRAEDLDTKPSLLPEEVNIAIERAQIAYPDLPWSDDTPMKKIEVFATELEDLCRKHGIWIRETLPTTCPVVYMAHDDFETGYTLSPVMNGGGLFLTRRTSHDT